MIGDEWNERYLKLVGIDQVERDMTTRKSSGEKWITFVGHGRSGHTIISAILDSHPNVRVAEEQKYIAKWSQQGWTRDKIVPHLLSSGQGKERKFKALPGSGAWTGEHKRLAVGDKWGYDAVGLVRTGRASVEVLKEFTDHMGMDLKVIHTIRDPYDNICAWLDSPKYKRMYGTGNSLYMKSIRQYTRFYEYADRLLKRYDHFDLHNAEICADPRRVITEMAEYLELPVVEPWLTNAANSLFKRPNKRADRHDWPDKWVRNIDERVITRWPEYFERYKR